MSKINLGRVVGNRWYSGDNTASISKPLEGDMFFNIDKNSIYQYKNNKWELTSSIGGKKNADLGKISQDPNHPISDYPEELNDITNSGLYTFNYDDGIYNKTYLMLVEKGIDFIKQNIYYDKNVLVRTFDLETETWTKNTVTLANTSETNSASQKTASGNTSSKIFLIGVTTQSSNAQTTYSHDTVYVDTSGRICGTSGVYTNKMYIPTTSGGSTYGVGTNGQVLMSNGSTAFWGTVSSGSGGSKIYKHSLRIYLENFMTIPYLTTTIYNTSAAPISSTNDLYNNSGGGWPFIPCAGVGESDAFSGVFWQDPFGSTIISGLLYNGIEVNVKKEDGYTTTQIIDIVTEV